MDTPTTDRQFANDVLQGLSANPKYLMSRYFYDARGDRIFQRIMASPDYYLSDCELELLRERSDEIAAEIARGAAIELIELGSGDGQKIRHLLDALRDIDPGFTYRPVDISSNSLDLLEERIAPGRPWLDLQPVNANYLSWLESLPLGRRPRVFAFMGSNLGNFGRHGSVAFLRKVRSAMAPRDALLIGLDLKKDPAVIRRAYDDPGGLTKSFNRNLLRRINRELGADFDPLQFNHRPTYDPQTGAARSYLVSRVHQVVRIDALQRTFEFAAGEKIFTEVSQKYDQAMIDGIAADAGFEVARAFHDRRRWFTDQVWRPVRPA